MVIKLAFKFHKISHTDVITAANLHRDREPGMGSDVISYMGVAEIQAQIMNELASNGTGSHIKEVLVSLERYRRRRKAGSSSKTIMRQL